MRKFELPMLRRSVRMFSYNGGHSKEVFHTKRMQRVFSVRFSGDGSYVFSGSDDMNVRIWKVMACLHMVDLTPSVHEFALGRLKIRSVTRQALLCDGVQPENAGEAAIGGNQEADIGYWYHALL